MASIEVDTRGLSALAGYCERQAARLAAINSPPSSGGSFQPSVAAVEVAHTDVAAAGTRLTARIQSTATAAWAAASEYDKTDTSAADEIVAVSGGTGVTAV
jgi:hypothetical protein